jgi:NAD(P)-dependent dehydrogenase (short-subunit alcohol dehydrogenase family)
MFRADRGPYERRIVLEERNSMSSQLDLSKELSGRRALVTGGSRGIGAAIAQRFLDAGAQVVVAARSRTQDTPRGATFIAANVATEAGVQALASQALQTLGGVDILVNNAGGGRAYAEGIASIPEAAWQDCFALNLFSAIRLTNAVLPALRESKAGAIVNISSTAATLPFPAFAHYSAAKAGLDMYSRALALELGSSGIRVNVVSPGPVTTPGGDETRRAFGEATGTSSDAFVQYVPLGRHGATEDVAEVVELLVSDRGKWLTGVNYRVDGGMTAR